MQLQVRIPGVSIHESKGTPVEAFGQQIIPVGRVLQARLPGGGLIWHRPVGVEIHRDGKVSYLPIHNVTRSSIITMTLMGMFIAVFVSFTKRGRKSKGETDHD